MMYRKTWTKYKRHGRYTYKYLFVGWFLFGFIPLYINRVLVSRY